MKTKQELRAIKRQFAKDARQRRRKKRPVYEIRAAQGRLNEALDRLKGRRLKFPA